MSKKGKYNTLSDEQIEILRNVHKQIIEEGLIRSGIENKDMPRFLLSAQRTFSTMLEFTQEILQDKVTDQEIRKEIREEEI